MCRLPGAASHAAATVMLAELGAALFERMQHRAEEDICDRLLVRPRKRRRR
jgi:hypothetical protein